MAANERTVQELQQARDSAVAAIARVVRILPADPRALVEAGQVRAALFTPGPDADDWSPVTPPAPPMGRA